jgi:hypothetical protein
MRHLCGSSEKTLSKMISLYVNLTVVKQTACLYRLSVKCWDSYPNGHEGAPRIRRRLVNIEQGFRYDAGYDRFGSCGAPALHMPEL